MSSFVTHLRSRTTAFCFLILLLAYISPWARSQASVQSGIPDELRSHIIDFANSFDHELPWEAVGDYRLNADLARTTRSLQTLILELQSTNTTTIQEVLKLTSFNPRATSFLFVYLQDAWLWKQRQGEVGGRCHSATSACLLDHKDFPNYILTRYFAYPAIFQNFSEQSEQENVDPVSYLLMFLHQKPHTEVQQFWQAIFGRDLFAPSTALLSSLILFSNLAASEENSLWGYLVSTPSEQVFKDVLAVPAVLTLLFLSLELPARGVNWASRGLQSTIFKRFVTNITSASGSAVGGITRVRTFLLFNKYAQVASVLAMGAGAALDQSVAFADAQVLYGEWSSKVTNLNLESTKKDSFESELYQTTNLAIRLATSMHRELVRTTLAEAARDYTESWQQWSAQRIEMHDLLLTLKEGKEPDLENVSVQAASRMHNLQRSIRHLSVEERLAYIDEMLAAEEDAITEELKLIEEAQGLQREFARTRRIQRARSMSVRSQACSAFYLKAKRTIEDLKITSQHHHPDLLCHFGPGILQRTLAQLDYLQRNSSLSAEHTAQLHFAIFRMQMALSTFEQLVLIQE